MPRLALFLSDDKVLFELEQILRSAYTSLLLITEPEKLGEFDIPFIIIVDNQRDLAKAHGMKLPEGTRFLTVARPDDSEVLGATFDLGADEVLSYPFSSEEVLARTEKYLRNFRTGPDA